MNDNIIKLREATGAGVMECKRALEEAKGDFTTAVSIINERGLAKAESKKERKTGAGLVYTYVHNDRVGVLLELRAETDFVVRSEPFRSLAHELSMQIAAMSPESVEDLLSEPYIKDESTVVSDLIKGTMAKVGENIQLEKFVRYEV
ncbi:translation elongation factor Ts [Patescibacteria group bacterium]|nr:translation elongation factor Ts [Patescibacteria group bacterium]MCL4540593.1 translation elongation factor Ts [Bacteroidota bacterium]